MSFRLVAPFPTRCLDVPPRTAPMVSRPITPFPTRRPRSRALYRRLSVNRVDGFSAHWKTGLRYRDESLSIELYGAFDDCLQDGDTYIPLDYKTRGSAPKPETVEFYQHQLDLYTLLLSENGYQTDGVAYLVYYFPKQVKEDGVVLFDVHPERIPTSVDDGLQLIQEAADLLNGPLPKHHTECDFCLWQTFADELE